MPVNLGFHTRHLLYQILRVLNLSWTNLVNFHLQFSSGRSTPSSTIPTLGVVNPTAFAATVESNQRSEATSPVLLSSSVVAQTSAASLPTFSVSRSSSSILRQVLQEDASNEQ